MALTLILAVIGLGGLCALAWTLAVYATPAVAGFVVARAAFASGSGYLGAGLVGIFAASLTYGAFQLAFVKMSSPLARVFVALLFAGPAAIAGYHLVHGIARTGVPSETWQQIFSVVGAVIAGGAALVRMVGMAGSASSPLSRTGATVVCTYPRTVEDVEILPPPSKLLPPPHDRGTDG